MKIVFLSGLILLSGLTLQAATLKVGTYNMQGWAGNAGERYKKLSDLMRSQNLLKGVSVLLVQESIEHKPASSAAQLASELGWKSYSKKRVSDNEGLGFIFPATVPVLSIDSYDIRSKDSPSDYARMALSMQIQDPRWGKVRILNTHLAHKATMGVTRKRQLAEVINWAQALEKKNPSKIVIFGGDFNTGPREEYYDNEFATLSQSAIPFRLLPAAGASYTWYDKKSGDREHIDHFFVARGQSSTPAFRASSYVYEQTTAKNFSDHNLVIMTLQ